MPLEQPRPQQRTEEVRAVTFDLDDTLWSGPAVLARANEQFHAFLAAQLPELAAAFPPPAFDALIGRLMRELPHAAHDFSFLRRHALRHCARDLRLAPDASDELLEQAFQAFLQPRSRPELFAGVEELLATLAQAPLGLGLGAITNGNCLLAELPPAVRARVAFLVSPEHAGVAKPARGIFDTALRHFPEHVGHPHVVHVGDHYECDVVGAKNAGLRTVWVNAAWDKPDALNRRALSAADAARFPAADAIVKDVTAVLAVVTLWNHDAITQQQEHHQITQS
ncbi:hypothetical protein PybrP1_003668 [[Pythium] brassicae (nom. inval.)]|nr:hypothetical protein PybrP1_003668 [[Pythium] brassicae (nom. inval.)]